MIIHTIYSVTVDNPEYTRWSAIDHDCRDVLSTIGWSF